MESPNLPHSSATHASYKMSWVAYVKSMMGLLLMLLMSWALTKVSMWIAVVCAVLAILWFAFDFLTIRSFLLYTDDHGVWVYRGILPWSKGVTGVKWRDLEDAIYLTNFISWVFQSYSIRVGHRFTKTSEIVLPHIAQGHKAVMHINELHRKVLLGENAENLN